MKKPVFGRFRPDQTQTSLKNHARGLKFRKEELYYPCSENKGADQLRGYREADLRLCFRICKKKRFALDEAHMSHVLRKPVFRVSDQVRHKPDCTVTEDG